MRLAPLLLFPALLAAQETPQAFTNARIVPIVGDPIPSGTLVVHRGKIVSVGANVAIPSDAQQHDAQGKTILPGYVDTHSHIGGVSGGDGSSPIQPEVRTLDSINPRDARLQKAQAGGITTVNIMSGSGHLLSGQTTYIKLRDVKTIEELAVRNPDGTIAGGIKMANGTNPRKGPPFPGTRAKAAALARTKLIAAQEYAAKLAAAEDGDGPDRDLAMESLGEALSGKRIVHFHTHRQDDIMTVLRLAREFNLRVVLQHVSDARFVAKEIASSEQIVGSSLILIDSPGGKIEAKDNSFGNGVALEQAGALAGFHTDDGITDSRFFARQAALAVRAGMSRDAALYGLTMAGAVMLDLQDRVGSLEPGKDADFILLDGDPLSVYTHVLETWVDGNKVFDRSDPKDRLYAVGGFGASHDQWMDIHDLEAEGH